MAMTIGTEYDHIDITNGVQTIRHPLKDASARENLVKVQDTQPESNDNVVWVKETPENEVQVPTYDEFSELKSAFEADKDTIFDLEQITITNWERGGVKENDGVATVTSTTSYNHFILNVIAGNTYTVKLNQTTSSTYPYYIFLTDSSDNVIARFAPKPSVEGYYEYSVFVHSGATKMYVMYKTDGAYLPITKKYVYTTTTDIAKIQANIGTMISKETDVTPESVTIGGVNGTVGDAINVTTSTGYSHVIVTVSPGERYKVITLTNVSTAYPYYVYCTDVNGIIKGRYGEDGGEASRKTYLLTIPDDATKMYVMQRGNNIGNINIFKLTDYPLQEQILDIQNGGTGETENELLAMNGLATASALNASVNGVSFAFITDTHSNGEFLNLERTELITGLDSQLSVSTFCNVLQSGMIDFGIHCGDVISAYNISKKNYEKMLAWYMRDYDGFGKPMFFVKGNHECNHEDGWYNQADVITPGEYFYNTQKVSADKKTVNPLEPFGGYYYVDNETYKIRFIMLNAYIDPITNGATVGFGEAQDAWFANALELQGKEDAPKWGIVVFCHPSAGTSNTIKRLRAYSGPGTLIGLIHGHAHQDEYTNANNYNNIGVDRAYAQTSEFGSNRCCISIFTLIPTTQSDNASGIIYETRIGRGESRSFSWGTNAQLT